jgi:hypothetical protein
MRAWRIVKNSSELQSLERRNYDDADLAGSFDPDTIPQSACDGCAGLPVALEE